MKNIRSSFPHLFLLDGAAFMSVSHPFPPKPL